MNNFAVLDIAYAYLTGGVEVSITTNNPCHLTLYWTLNIPLRHKTTRTFRGITMPWGAYFCFTAWTALPQQEAGDTLTHTFDVTDWPHCETRWFCFAGTVTGLESPSISAIYMKHHRARHTYTLQASKDTFFRASHPNANYGNYTYMSVSRASAAPPYFYPSLLSFQLPSIPPEWLLLEATLKLHYITTLSYGLEHYACKVLFGGWWEMAATFNELAPGIPWSSGSFSNTDYVLVDPLAASAIIPPGVGKDMFWNLKPITEDARTLTPQHVNLCIIQPVQHRGVTWYLTREYPYFNYYPELFITLDQYP